MNGTVTMQSEVAATTSRELAEKVRAAIIEKNRKDELPQHPFHAILTDIKEVNAYETEEEIPILNEQS